MELLQSQAPAEGELLGNSAVRTFRHWSLDIGYYNFEKLDIRFRTFTLRLSYTEKVPQMSLLSIYWMFIILGKGK